MEAAETIDPRSFACGRPRKTDMRAAMNAIFFLLRTGCPWRYLPRDEFPPRSTVYNIFRKFQKDGVWEAILEELHAALREQLGREASPTAAVIDSQTLKAAEKGAVLMARQAMTPERRSRGARFTPLPTPKACRCGPSFIPQASRTATVRPLSLTRSTTAFPGSNWSPELLVRETCFEALLMDFGFGPGEGLGIFVIGLDEGIDVLLELFDRGE